MIKFFINCIKIKLNSYIIDIFLLMDMIEKLDCDLRTDIYLSITGFFIAIVIFVAEFVSNDDKMKLDKKVLISKTHIYKNLLEIIMTLLCLLGGKLTSGIFYYIYQMFVNAIILISIHKILDIFKNIIELILNDDLFAIERDKYIKNKFNEYNNNIKNLNERKKYFKLKCEIENSSLVKYEEYGVTNNEYKPVFAKTVGVLKNIDLKCIFNKVKGKVAKDGIVIITALEGEKIYSKNVLFYIKKDYIDMENSILSCFYIEKDEKHLDEDVSNILEDCIKKINNCNYYNKIESEIKSLIESIVQNNWNYVLDDLWQKLHNYSRELVKTQDDNKIDVLYDLIEDLCCILIKNDKIYDFESYHNILFTLLKYKLDKENVDSCEVAYKYTLFINSCIYRSYNKINENEMIDCILSKMLSFIKILINRQEVNVISDVVFYNIVLSLDYRHKDNAKSDSFVFQFICGIICALIYENKKLEENNYKYVKELIEEIRLKYKFHYTYNVSELIFLFKDNIDKKSNIQKTYDNFCFENIDNKYKSFWMGTSIDNIYVLIGLIYIYDIFHTNIKNEAKISRNDRCFYEDLLKRINENEYQKLFDIFDDDKNSKIELVKETVNKIIKIVNIKEHEYKKNIKLNNTKVKMFKEILRNTIKNENEIVSLIEFNKRNYTNQIVNKGIMHPAFFLERECLADDVSGYDNFAQNIGNVIIEGLSDRIVDYLVNNSKKVESLNKTLEKFDNLDNIVILCGYSNYWKLFKSKNTYLFNEIEIPVIEINKKDLVLIINKDSLPNLNYYKYDESRLAYGDFEDYVYIELLDGADEIYQDIIIKEKMKIESEKMEKEREKVSEKCYIFVVYFVDLEEVESKEIYLLNYEKST